jgi:hypothetical protein
MSRENFEQDGSPELTLVKTPLEEKMDQLALMRNRKGVLELKRKHSLSPSETDKVNAEYEQVSALVEEIEADLSKLKAEEAERLEKKFKIQ